jgi:hypothetical protein
MEETVAAPVYKTENTAVGDPTRFMLALASPTSGGSWGTTATK